MSKQRNKCEFKTTVQINWKYYICIARPAVAAVDILTINGSKEKSGSKQTVEPFRQHTSSARNCFREINKHFSQKRLKEPFTSIFSHFCPTLISTSRTHAHRRVELCKQRTDAFIKMLHFIMSLSVLRKVIIVSVIILKKDVHFRMIFANKKITFINEYRLCLGKKNKNSTNTLISLRYSDINQTEKSFTEDMSRRCSLFLRQAVKAILKTPT